MLKEEERLGELNYEVTAIKEVRRKIWSTKRSRIARTERAREEYERVSQVEKPVGVLAPGAVPKLQTSHHSSHGALLGSIYGKSKSRRAAIAET